MASTTPEHKMVVPPNYDTTGIQHFTIKDFTFHSGAKLPSVTVAYRTFGDPSAPRRVLIPTCYGGRINSTLNFSAPGQCFDVSDKKHFVVVVAMLGNGESTAPSTLPPGEFPRELDYSDVVRSQHTLVTKHLGWTSAHAVCGFSMGGQQTYYWAVMYPSFMEYAIPICGSARTSPFNYAFLEGPKNAMLASADYADGAYRAKGIKPERGLRAFGSAYFAWIFSAAWFNEAKHWQQEQNQQGKTIAAYMASEGSASFMDWDAEDLLVLLGMWQRADVGALHQDGSYEAALKSIQAKTLVMPARTDQYFVPEESAIEVQHLQHGKLAVIETIWGHAAGGGLYEPDTKWMDAQIKSFIGDA